MVIKEKRLLETNKDVHNTNIPVKILKENAFFCFTKTISSQFEQGSLSMKFAPRCSFCKEKVFNIHFFEQQKSGKNC